MMSCRLVVIWQRDQIIALRQVMLFSPLRKTWIRFKKSTGPCDTTLYGLTVSNILTGNFGTRTSVYYRTDRPRGDFFVTVHDCTRLRLNGTPDGETTSAAGSVTDTEKQNCEAAQIFNLDGLSGLKHIQGELRLQTNPKLTQVSVGLASLERIDGDINLQDNDALVGLDDGLSNLATLDGSLYVAGNMKLTSLLLGQLPAVGGGLALISGNPALSQIDLTGLTELVTLNVTRNDSLIDVSGFSNLESLSGSLQVNENSRLNDLKGLEKLTVVGGDVSINTNGELTTLGLTVLQKIGGNLIVNGHPRLRAMDLPNLISVGG